MGTLGAKTSQSLLSIPFLYTMSTFSYTTKNTWVFNYSAIQGDYFAVCVQRSIKSRF
jgi:hypothetical protein